MTGRRRVRTLLGLGTISLVLGIFAIPASAADGTFMLSPTSGPAGSTVSVASGTACPPNGADLRVRFYGDAGKASFVGEVDADDATGHWAGQITIPAVLPPIPFQLHAFCNDHFAYQPQTFTVTSSSAPALPLSSSRTVPAGGLPQTSPVPTQVTPASVLSAVAQPASTSSSTTVSAAAPSTIPRTGPGTEPRDLAPTALLIAAAGGFWLAAAKQYRLAAG
jgi:hypothetical protein